jgi:hypothetical protein
MVCRYHQEGSSCLILLWYETRPTMKRETREGKKKKGEKGKRKNNNNNNKLKGNDDIIHEETLGRDVISKS